MGLPNITLVPTRKSEALLLAAQRGRWASRMKAFVLALIVSLAAPAAIAGEPGSAFDAALEKWRAVDLKSYSFIFE